MRAVSLAPSATAAVHAMGAEATLLAATEHCVGNHDSVGGWLTPDVERVVSLDPDVVLTADALQAEIAQTLRERGVRVVHTAPETLTGVYDAVERVGVAIHRAEAGTELAAAMRERVARIQAVTPAESPVVYCEEWPDPPMAAGNWVPDAVAAAGGRYPFVDAGERSREIDEERVRKSDPEHVVLHYCGQGDDADVAAFNNRWDLDAEVHVLHDDLLNQPSPRLVEGIEALAREIHGVEIGGECEWSI